MHVAVIDPSLFTLPYDQHLCAALSKAGMTVSLVGRQLRPEERMDPADYRVHAHFYHVSERLRATQFFRHGQLIAKGLEHVVDMRRLLRQLQLHRPDVIHFQWTPVPMFDRYLLQSFRKIAPIVLTVHDTNPFHGDPSSRVQLLGWTQLLRTFNHLIVHTDTSRRNLIDAGIDSARMSIIPHGVLSNTTTVASLAKTDATDERAILLFGAIKPYKGVDILIEAFAALPEELRRRNHVLIAGKPFMPVEPLQDLARKLGIANRIRWDVRFIPDAQIPALFHQAKLVVFPYRDIDASGVLMTALAHGVPVVATRVGDLGERLVDGVHGYVVPPGDPAAFAVGMQRVLEAPEQAAEMGRRVQELSRATVSWQEIAERTHALYVTLIERRTR